VRRRIPVTHSIGLMAAEEAEREVAQVAKEGIRTIKIKVGVDPDRDVDLVRRVRETVGPGIALCVNANQGYRTPSEAIRTYRRMERFELIYFEQPVEGIERLAEVARAIDAPVMADESAWNAHDIIEIIEKRAAQIVSIYTTKPGGLYRALEVAAVARAAGLICNINGSAETGIGNLANLQLAAVAAAAVLSCVVPVSTPAQAQSGQVAGIYYKDALSSRQCVSSTARSNCRRAQEWASPRTRQKSVAMASVKKGKGHAAGRDCGSGSCHEGRRTRCTYFHLA